MRLIKTLPQLLNSSVRTELPLSLDRHLLLKDGNPPLQIPIQLLKSPQFALFLFNHGIQLSAPLRLLR